MIKDPVVTPLEPFTPQEEQALFDRLDLLSVAALEDYIGSAKTSLSNKALAPSWRVRVELALTRAELVLVREEAAAIVAAAAAAAAPPPAPAPTPKAKKVKEAVADS